MSEHSYDVWKCPNPYGGCEDTLNPSWHAHCPICGCAFWRRSSETKVDQAPRERVSTSAPDSIDADNINDATMSDSNLRDRENIAGSSELIGSWSRLINTERIQPSAAAAFGSATEKDEMVRLDIDRAKQIDGGDRQVSIPTATVNDVPLALPGDRTILYQDYDTVSGGWFEPLLKGGWTRLRIQCVSSRVDSRCG